MIMAMRTVDVSRFGLLGLVTSVMMLTLVSFVLMMMVWMSLRLPGLAVEDGD